MGHVFSQPALWHVISYSLLLGSSFYQSFIGGIIAFRALPRAQFSQLQQKIFPVYFLLQTVLPLATAYTVPGIAHYAQLLDDRSPLFWNTTQPLLIAFLSSSLNLAFIGPWTTDIMKERKRQETKDGKKHHDPGEHSAEMKLLNKRFSTAHGVSSFLNLVALLATAYYGLTLGGRLSAIPV